MNGWLATVARYRSEVRPDDFAARPPHPRLRRHVWGYMGYRSVPSGVIGRYPVPFDGVTVGIDFVPPDRRRPGLPPVIRTFVPVTGLYEHAVRFEQIGEQHGVTVGLTVRGAFALFAPAAPAMRDLANQRANLDELLDSATAATLVDRLGSAPSWEARFAILDELLSARIAAGPELADVVLRACGRLSECAGRTTIAALAEEVGVSTRQLESRFGEQIGLAPKTFARLLRFQHAMRLLTTPTVGGLPTVAVSCGYADYAHLCRDFRLIAGRTPTQLIATA